MFHVKQLKKKKEKKEEKKKEKGKSEGLQKEACSYAVQNPPKH